MYNRWKEGKLLIWVIFLVTAGFILVHYALFPEKKVPLFHLFSFIGTVLVIHVALSILKYRGDMVLFPLSSILAGFGLIAIYRLKPDLVSKQTGLFFASVVIFLAIVFFFQKYAEMKKFKYLIATLGVVILVLTVIFGVEVNGAKLWIRFGGFQFQPVEIVKILLVIFLASYLSEYYELITFKEKHKWLSATNLKFLFPLLVMWGMSVLILVFQKDLGMSLIAFGVFLAMFYVATSRYDLCSIGVLLFMGAGYVCYRIFPHVRVRINAWLNPWQDISGSGYQIVQSLFALGSGGLTGKGLGLGEPYWIPEVHTDFIFAALGEELGLWGTAILVIIYLILAIRGFKIAIGAKDEFDILLATGLTFILAWQSFIIIGGVTKLIPLTGITLPFISYGGSSLLSNFIIIGLLLKISEKNYG